MITIDSHIHVGVPDACIADTFDFDYDLFNTYEETINLMDENKIDKAIIFPVPHRQISVVQSNNYVLEAYQHYPDRFIPFCRIDENLEDNLLHKGFKGVKLHLLYEDVEIKKIKKELRIIEDANVPLVLHAKFTGKVKQVEEILKIAPNIKIILAHMGRGHLYTGEQVVENAIGLKRYSNVYYDLSTVGDDKAIINCCEIVGYDHVLYASDYPFGKEYYKEKYNYLAEKKAILDLFTEDQAQLIFHKNIEQLLNQEGILIRRVKKSDVDELICLFDELSDKDKKYLAYNNKSTLIRQMIRSERHCYLACFNGKVVGFMRESGRPNNYSLLEEIVVSPSCRGMGIAKKLLEYYHNSFCKNLAKTNAENIIMMNLLKKNGYIAVNPDAKRIINWERNAEVTNE